MDPYDQLAETSGSNNQATFTFTVGNAQNSNITPYQPQGWSAPIVVATTTGTHSDSTSLRTNDTVYVDWALINNGAGPTSVRFYTSLYVNGERRGRWTTSPPVEATNYQFVNDFNIGTLSAGSHTLRLVVDSDNELTESNESDNEYVRTVFVQGTGSSSLSTPTSVFASDGTFTTKVRVTWNGVDGADGYYIYRKPSSNESYIRIASADRNATSYEDQLACGSGQYYYSVSAFNQSSESPRSGSNTGHTESCGDDVSPPDDTDQGCSGSKTTVATTLENSFEEFFLFGTALFTMLTLQGFGPKTRT